MKKKALNLATICLCFLILDHFNREVIAHPQRSAARDPCPHLPGDADAKPRKLVMVPGTFRLCCRCPENFTIDSYCNAESYGSTVCKPSSDERSTEHSPSSTTSATTPTAASSTTISIPVVHSTTSVPVTTAAESHHENELFSTSARTKPGKTEHSAENESSNNVTPVGQDPERPSKGTDEGRDTNGIIATGVTVPVIIVAILLGSFLIYHKCWKTSKIPGASTETSTITISTPFVDNRENCEQSLQHSDPTQKRLLKPVRETTMSQVNQFEEYSPQRKHRAEPFREDDHTLDIGQLPVAGFTVEQQERNLGQRNRFPGPGPSNRQSLLTMPIQANRNAPGWELTAIQRCLINLRNTDVLLPDEDIHRFGFNFGVKPGPLQTCKANANGSSTLYLSEVFSEIRRVNPNLTAKDVVDYFQGVGDHHMLAQELIMSLNPGS